LAQNRAISKDVSSQKHRKLLDGSDDVDDSHARNVWRGKLDKSVSKAGVLALACVKEARRPLPRILCKLPQFISSGVRLELADGMNAVASVAQVVLGDVQLDDTLAVGQMIAVKMLGGVHETGARLACFSQTFVKFCSQSTR